MGTGELTEMRLSVSGSRGVTRSGSLSMSPFPRRLGRRREVFLHRNLDDARAVELEGRADGVCDLVRLRHVIALGAIHLGELVEARIDEIDPDVALVEVAHLLAFFRAVAAVVE